MANFEPTEDEKATASYLQWDDAELGKFTKYIGLVFKEIQNDEDGLKKVSVSSCAMTLIGSCIDVNASELTLNMDGFTHDGSPKGDWTVIIKQRERNEND